MLSVNKAGELTSERAEALKAETEKIVTPNGERFIALNDSDGLVGVLPSVRKAAHSLSADRRGFQGLDEGAMGRVKEARTRSRRSNIARIKRA